MSSRKKIIIFLLILLTISLGGASIFISQQLQNAQAPTDSNADTITNKLANTEIYDELRQGFINFGCNGLLSDSIINLVGLESFDELKDNALIINSNEPQTNAPVDCNIQLTQEGEIRLTLYSYTGDPKSDFETTVNNINRNITTQIKNGSVMNSPYTFGTGTSNGTCQTNIFHKLNDFEYISITYSDFNKSCKQLEDLSTQLTYIIAKAANTISLETRKTNSF